MPGWVRKVSADFTREGIAISPSTQPVEL
jgi:hypothetical protein